MLYIVYGYFVLSAINGTWVFRPVCYKCHMAISSCVLYIVYGYFVMCAILYEYFDPCAIHSLWVFRPLRYMWLGRGPAYHTCSTEAL